MHLPTVRYQVSNYLLAVVINPLHTDDAYMYCLMLATWLLVGAMRFENRVCN